MKANIEALITSSVEKLLTSQNIDCPDLLKTKIMIERTRDAKHGDYACNAAMILAKPFGQNPRELAKTIIEGIDNRGHFKAIEVAGPGFINFHLTDSALQDVLEEVLRLDGRYGHSTKGDNKSVIIEFVSSNPTGPLHVGHGRHAAYGASVANLLETVGFRVHREYYINDAGRQMQILAVSIWLRYLQLFGENFPFPQNGYKGAYIVDVAKDLKVDHRDKFCRPLTELLSHLFLPITD